MVLSEVESYSMIPRLTRALRENQTEDTTHWSFDNMYLIAKEVMERKKSKTPHRVDDKDDVSGLWSKLVSLEKERDENKKESFRTFLKHSKSLLGEQSETSEIASSSVFLLKTILQSKKLGELETKTKLKSLFGSIDHQVYTSLIPLCEKIAGFIGLDEDGEDSSVIQQKSRKELTESYASKKEFGENYDFVFPHEEQDDEFLNMIFKYNQDIGIKNTSMVEDDSSFIEEPVFDEDIDRQWLKRQCEYYAASKRNGPFAKDLALSIYEIIASHGSDELIQSSLLDLIGFEGLQFVELLLKHREEFLEKVNVSMALKEPINLPKAKKVEPQPQFFGSRVTIISEHEKKLQKQVKKEEKRLKKLVAGEEHYDQILAALGFDTDLQRKVNELEKSSSTLLFESQGSQIKYPHVYSSTPQTFLSLFGTKYSLPVGTSRINEKDYEQVSLPESKAAPKMIEERLVSISDFDEFARPAFKGYKSLNRLQSMVFDVAYNTNENMLVCAPTGAGKTDVAMTTVLKEIKNHVVGGIVPNANFKIIYVAPMKALASEVVQKFSSRLAYLNVIVSELTGDMQMTKAEIAKTHMIVTTPEKWDVVTRKGSGDNTLAQLVKLLIIDEVHLLHDDRGPVIESLIARTLRQVESSQTMIRIVGLSATLPNFIDVAQFLKVNPMVGLFFFDNGFRPVPLSQVFIGVKPTNPLRQIQAMNEVCYKKVVDSLKKGNQVMVFVNSRKDTLKTAMILRDMAVSKGEIGLFQPEEEVKQYHVKKDMDKARSKEIKELFRFGFSVHHAGMLRQDRNLVEKVFAEGSVKVLCCTATLAWGVNLPAHTVIIKGTQLYNPERGAFVDLGILDVMQIFGRAGRPQFDTSGEGIIITTHDKLTHYLSQMTSQTPIESQFVSKLTDNLNAEISLGTVTNVREAVEWLSYTYLFVRMKKNPLYYGVTYDELRLDPQLYKRRNDLIKIHAKHLDKARMIRFDEGNGYLSSTDLGRTASHYYIKYDSIEVFNEGLKDMMTEADILSLISMSREFENIKVRDEELAEMDEMMESTCVCQVQGGVENYHGKVNILLQNYISKGSVDDFSLVSDTAYVAQNATRIARALFEIALKKSWVSVASKLLTLCKCVERRMWSFEHPLSQFGALDSHIIQKLEQREASMETLMDLKPDEIGELIRHVRMGSAVKTLVNKFPKLDLDVSIQPITRTILRVQIRVTAPFKWSDNYHGTVEPWWIWVEDAENEHIYHYEHFLLHKKQHKEEQILVFTIPIFEPLPPQYYLKAVSDRWIGAETIVPISFQHLILPDRHPPHTELLDLHPLPITALQNEEFQKIYESKFSHFNPIQTQIFHTLYHTDNNVLVGAPTGSGKTVTCEIAMFRVFRLFPNQAKVVYVAPLKALVRERVIDWSERIAKPLNKKLVELTGDVMPDLKSIKDSDIIITTPEKWDGVSRSWQSRDYVQSVALVIIDEIHLLGQDRGPILEVIVSRMNFMSQRTKRKVRIVGLSTALANARDVADWMSIGEVGMYNFRPSVRPVPLEVHISGFPGKHYCPRMATMNKPAYLAIRSYSPDKPVIIFVSSRRQTRLTAQDLISYCGMENNPRQFLSISEYELDGYLDKIKDVHLRFSLQFGIGLHHAGLIDQDRKIVEELFVNRKIQVLVATSTLAWGVNTPTHLVIVKGTEFFDAKSKRYVDYPITDVLQMMGRAGRPQYDDTGKAVIFAQDVKKNFYKKFLYEPFPVESSLHQHLHDHINAEVVAGTISSKQDAIDYITWTYYFRRMLQNPTYYGLEFTTAKAVNEHLSNLIENTLFDLEDSGCVVVKEGFYIETTTSGRIASFYYLQHKTLRMFMKRVTPDLSLYEVLQILSDASEYEELPVRHNEDEINAEMSSTLPFRPSFMLFDSPHTKTLLLLQAHMSRSPLPVSDYITDTKSVLDQAIRVLQALVDFCAESGYLNTTFHVMNLQQGIKQARWHNKSHLLWLPHIEEDIAKEVEKRKGIQSPKDLVGKPFNFIEDVFKPHLSTPQIKELFSALQKLPRMRLSCQISLDEPGNPKIEKKDGFYELVADKEYEMIIEIFIEGENETKEGSKLVRKAYTPKFPKPQNEAWWAVIGQEDRGELLALKRIAFGSRTTCSLSFFTPAQPGQYNYTVYIVSDSYLGLDKRYEVPIIIPEK